MGNRTHRMNELIGGILQYSRVGRVHEQERAIAPLTVRTLPIAVVPARSNQQEPAPDFAVVESAMRHFSRARHVPLDHDMTPSSSCTSHRSVSLPGQGREPN